ncbi:MAG: class 3 adenylate cyclase [Gammaproteobacteria bacterium]|jgi:class 3 adenylate cyclase
MPDQVKQFSMLDDEFIFSDVEYLRGHEQRARKLLTVALYAIAILAALWAVGLFVLIGFSTPVLINAVVAVLAVLVLNLGHRVAYSVLHHMVFWLAFLYIWLLQAFADGISAPHTASAHLWFMVIVIAAFLTSIKSNRATLFVFATLPFASLVVCEFGLIRFDPVASFDVEQKGLIHGITVISVFLTTALLTIAWLREAIRAEASMVNANNRLEALLENMLPRPVSERLRREGRKFADGVADCTVLFADIVGFTQLASNMPAEKLVRLLDEIFSRFDELAHAAGVEKIKTIGDAYMVAAGLPDPRPDHAVAIVKLGVEMRAVVREYADLGIRIGINSGSVVAGIIGTRRFIYDLWGDTVNIASRMESHGVADEIQISESTYLAVQDTYECTPRGKIPIKGKGEMAVYLVVGRKLKEESDPAS